MALRAGRLARFAAPFLGASGPGAPQALLDDMNIRFTPPRAPVIEIGTPSPLLAHLAGGYAEQVAGLWPAPHAAYLLLPAARRHLICLWLEFGRRGVDVRLLLDLPARRLIPAVLPAAPSGLIRALGRLGEIAWSSRDYRLLLDRLAEPAAAKVLRHAPAITPDAVRRLAALPSPVLQAGLGRLVFDGGRAELMAEVYDAILLRDGADAAARALTRWGRARDLRRLHAMVLKDFGMETYPRPFAGSLRLRPLVTRAAMLDAAQRYGNCLAGELHYAARGEAAYFEWVGPPGAVIELNRDAYIGWRLVQARAKSNAPVPPEQREAIMAELRSWGVSVGRSGWELERDLQAPADYPPPPAAAAERLAETFGD